MRRTTTILALFLLPACIIGACTKKKKEPQTIGDRLVGNWKKVKYATDDNNNAQIDSWEIRDLEGNVENELVFNTDSTGVENSNLSPSLYFTWQTIGDSVRISRAGHNVTTYYINSINSSNLTLTANTTLGLAWYLYQRK